ncbi:MAG: SLBB domain-containing protein [Armatimonadetes bacterium]|nr:SLBB domain-containing protein [Armatimonadota bacterium]
MQAYALAAVLLAGVAQNPGQSLPPGIKLKFGDRFSVIVRGFPEYSRGYVVLDDGTVVGYGFNRFKAEGMTLGEVKAYIKKELVKTIKDPDVTILVDSIRSEFVFVNSVTGQVIGPVNHQPDLSLRMVVSRVSIPERKEDYEVRVFREGKEILRSPLIKVLDGSTKLGDMLLSPNDSISVLDRPAIRVWATGAVKRPSEYRVIEGSTAQQLLLQSGGVSDGLELTSLYKVKLRRGPQVLDVDVSPTAQGFPLEAGDMLFVEVPKVLHITLGGEVNGIGERRIREGLSLLAVLEGAGGITGGGSYENVLVFRKGQTYVVDAGKIFTEGKLVDFVVEDDDVIWVQQNLKRVTVLGEIAQPGQILMKPGIEVRLADAVAARGGVGLRGSMRHTYIGRKQADGKIKVTEYHLDAYLKDGDTSQNPLLEPGDMILIGTPKGFTIEGATQALSSLLIVETIIRR